MCDNDLNSVPNAVAGLVNLEQLDISKNGNFVLFFYKKKELPTVNLLLQNLEKSYLFCVCCF